MLAVNPELDQACLHAIFLTDPTNDIQKIETKKGRLLENTGSWIFDDISYIKWLKDHRSRTLWLHGDPGKGKTMIAISMIRELSKQSPFGGSCSATMLAYFFCSNEDDRCNTADAILRGLIYQILCQRPGLCAVLRSEYERHGERLLSSPDSTQFLWRIFQKILKFPHLREVFIVIDALDECDSASLQTFLAFLEPSVDPKTIPLSHDLVEVETSCKIKWLLTSRNDDAIRQPLSGSLEISLEINAAHVDNSLRSFIDRKVAQLKRAKRYDDKLSAFVEEQLRQKAEGTFLWVALACQELCKPTVRSLNTKSVLSKLPSGLTALYDRIMDQVLNNEDKEMAGYAKAILGSMLVAFRPLKLEELAVAATLPYDHRYDLHYLTEYVNLCGSMVTQRDETVYFVHLSAKKYIMSAQTAHLFDVAIEHMNLAIRCFEQISDPEIHYSQITAERTERPLLPRVVLEYPTLFWMDHARLASENIAKHFDPHLEFFEPRSKHRKRWFDIYWSKTSAKWEKKPYDLAAIHVAALGGLSWLISVLLNSDLVVDVHAKDALGNDSLIWAAKNGYRNVTELLLNIGARVTTVNEDGMTALSWAATNGHQQIVHMLAKGGGDVRVIDRTGWTPLQQASHHGHTHVVACLLDHNADIDMRDAASWTALQRACSSGDLALVHVLLKGNANPEVRDREGMTPLGTAAWNGHADVVTTLLKNMTDIEAYDNERWTALHHASWNGHAAVIQILLQSGANVDARNKDGNTPLLLAAWNGCSSAVRLLLKYSADVNATCHKGETALQQA